MSGAGDLISDRLSPSPAKGRAALV